MRSIARQNTPALQATLSIVKLKPEKIEIESE